MANQRREGWRVGSYSAPAELIAAAKEVAAKEGVSLSAVIRDALTRYVNERGEV